MLGTAFIVAVILLVVILPSIRIIGPTQVGLVMKRFSSKKLSEDNPIAFRGEAGYQAVLLMPGWRFRLWILYKVEKHPWVQIPAGEIGVVVAQVADGLTRRGARKVYAAVIHGLFTEECVRVVDQSPIRRLLATDTIENRPAQLTSKVETISVAPLFAEAIRRIHNRQSISVLFQA